MILTTAGKKFIVRFKITRFFFFRFWSIKYYAIYIAKETSDFLNIHLIRDVHPYLEDTKESFFWIEKDNVKIIRRIK